jgi:hypothetical protein
MSLGYKVTLSQKNKKQKNPKTTENPNPNQTMKQ